jgi:hypothetical protein
MANFFLFPIFKQVTIFFLTRNILACLITISNRVELGYNVLKGTEYFLSLLTSVVITEECNVMVNNQELIGTAEYLTL